MEGQVVGYLVAFHGAKGNAEELERWEQRAAEIEAEIAGVHIRAPMLALETVAAGGGSIVNISSIAGKEGNPNAAAYSAAKAAMWAATRSAARECVGRREGADHRRTEVRARRWNPRRQ